MPHMVASLNALAPAFLARRAEREARPARQGFWSGVLLLVFELP